MCKTKIYRSGHLFCLVWPGRVPHSRLMFNAWMWCPVCLCSCPSVWRAWCPSPMAEALGTALSTEREPCAGSPHRLAGLHLLLCISHWCIFWQCQHSSHMFSVCLISAPAKENQQGAGKSKTGACGLWLSWTGLKGSSAFQKHWCCIRLGRGAGCWKRAEVSQGLFCRSNICSNPVHYGSDFVLLDTTWVIVDVAENVRISIIRKQGHLTWYLLPIPMPRCE